MRRVLLRSWLGKPALDDEVDGELAFHREMRLREYLAAGLTAEEAARAVEARFGDLDRARATCRRLGKERDRIMLRHEYVTELRQDAWFGLRQLRKNPGFACVAMLTLTLGIGGATAIFSVVNAVVLRPLGFHEPERLVFLFETWQDTRRGGVSPGNFTEWRRRSDVFSDLAAISWSSFNVTDGETPERVLGATVTGQFFAAMAVPAAAGRTFDEAEDRPGHDDVVVLSHRLFTRLFAGRRDVIGSPLRLSGRTRTVIGVMPASFDRTAESEDLWVPAAFTAAEQADFDNHRLSVVARVKPEVSDAQVREQLGRLAAQLAREQPIFNQGRGADFAPMLEVIVGDYRERLFILLGAVGLVLLIACANVANLLLARGSVRASELALRAALGAGRARLLRQLLTENLVLGALGALGGLLFASLALQALIRLAPAGVPRLEDARIDATTFAVAAALAALSSLVFGLIPAHRATLAGAPDRLRGGRSGDLGASRDRVRTALVAAEVALALVLLVGSGLLIRTALSLGSVDPGFEPAGVLSARIALPKEEYLDDARVTQTLERMVAEARTVAGVSRAAVVSQVPLGPGGNGNGLIPEGRPFAPESAVLARLRLVSPDYFETMRIRLVEGRGFSAADRHGAQKVMIVSQSLARRAWPTDSAIGRRIACCEPGPGGERTPDYKTVVGVAADVRSGGPAVAPAPEFYLPISQAPSTPPGAAWDWVQRTMYVVIRTSGDPAALAPALGQALRRVDPTLPLFNVRTMDARLEASMATARFNTVLLATLGAVGLLLSVVGIYGVIAYFVGRRTQEIGVRLALGAGPRDVMRMVIGQAMKPVLVGLVLGVGAALAATRTLAAQLHGVSPRDPWTVSLVCLIFLGAALLASWLPARRAAGIDPTRALSDH